MLYEDNDLNLSLELKTENFDSLQDIFDQYNTMADILTRMPERDFSIGGAAWLHSVMRDWEVRTAASTTPSGLAHLAFDEMPLVYRPFLDFLFDDCGYHDFKGTVGAGGTSDIRDAVVGVWVGIDGGTILPFSSFLFELIDEPLTTADLKWTHMYRILAPSGPTGKDGTGLLHAIFEALRRLEFGDPSLYNLVSSRTFSWATWLSDEIGGDLRSVLTIGSSAFQPAYEAYLAGVPFDDLFFPVDPAEVGIYEHMPW